MWGVMVFRITSGPAMVYQPDLSNAQSMNSVTFKSFFFVHLEVCMIWHLLHPALGHDIDADYFFYPLFFQLLLKLS